MLIQMLFDGRELLFAALLFSFIFALSFHEFGHAYVAKIFGDRTAEQMGRLTLNPIPHIDPVGLFALMIMSFGWAKPVQTNPRNYTSKYASLWVAAAGPGMNFLLAVIAVNFYGLAVLMDWQFFYGPTVQIFFFYFTIINLILMVFNLIPLGSLDGHYILPYFLPRNLAYKYQIINAKYGNMVFLGLIALSIMGFPVFRYVLSVGEALIPFISWI